MSSDLSRYPWHMMHGLASAIHENQTRSLLPGAPTEPCSAVASCTDNGPGASKKPRLGDTSKAGPGNQQECQKLAQTPNAKQGQHSACGTSREADGHQDPLWIIHPRKGSNLTTPTPPAVRPGRRTQGQTGGSPPRHVAQRTAHNSAGGAFRETSTSSQHEARSDQTGSQQTGGGTPPQDRQQPKNPNSVCGTSREGELLVSNETKPSGLDRPSHLPTTARLHLLDDKLLVPLGFRVRPIRDGLDAAYICLLD